MAIESRALQDDKRRKCALVSASFHRPLFLLPMAAAAIAAFTVATPLRAENNSSDAFARCKTIADDHARLKCYEGAVDKDVVRSGAQDTPWRLIRSRDPRGGADAVAIMRTADMTQSDLGLAGLMFRCGESNIEVVVVTTEPFSPRVQPRVKIVAGAREVQLEAKVVPPFSALLLPAEATVLADGPWQSLPRLSIEIDQAQNAIHGTVDLSGLGPALAMLRASCPSR